MQLLNEKCREVSGHGEERSHYQPNRVRNSIVKNEFAKPGLSWQKGSLVMKSLLMFFAEQERNNANCKYCEKLDCPHRDCVRRLPYEKGGILACENLW